MHQFDAASLFHSTIQLWRSPLIGPQSAARIELDRRIELNQRIEKTRRSELKRRIYNILHI